ncbi:MULTISPECIES: three-Cys-motif partner protein TcmP [Cyanophyceae]|uniref:three-Cys-motif partner protein TcmP n=1 Tax=Cyanophyceae TaxID=3028117 RepID=UPI0018F02457|nr:three-Cys-motif partner protein TcmP [Trichocoleus sp. FACHB-40]
MFGGNWTTDKLERVRKYLKAYTTIMRRQNFSNFIYIDAFAGTGWLTLKQNEQSEQPSQLELFNFASPAEETSSNTLEGSARMALQVNPEFTKYIFIERDKKRFEELEKVKLEFPNRDILIKNSDANVFIREICNNQNWIEMRERAVLFLDPYGMQVPWETVEAIARTRAIDLWYLFPIGVALNRLLKKDGKINDSCRRKIDIIIGTTEWYNVFYAEEKSKGLFGEESRIIKVANFDLIKQYFIERLQTVFPGVANNPRLLLNSKNNPLYLLCFASSNLRGTPTAIKIAQDILRRE